MGVLTLGGGHPHPDPSTPPPDAVHSLTCAIMLLNTDLHGQVRKEGRGGRHPKNPHPAFLGCFGRGGGFVQNLKWGGAPTQPTLLPQRLGRAMTSAEFVANLSGMMDGQDFPREQLKVFEGGGEAL